MLEAERLGVYAVEDLQADRPRLQTLVARALDHLGLAQENHLLREEAARPPRPRRAAAGPTNSPRSSPRGTSPARSGTSTTWRPCSAASPRTWPAPRS